ncbi:unnamed protein product [Lactuca virosa]|uniref:Phage protein n=1 Tax=Lactuca virosa TaxID=75947 RepID=A0AAU9NPU4_9ASTR|nr:unnamed protein product [Lactuca virosa]
MKWLKEYQNQEVSLISDDELTKGRSLFLQAKDKYEEAYDENEYADLQAEVMSEESYDEKEDADLSLSVWMREQKLSYQTFVNN